MAPFADVDYDWLINGVKKCEKWKIETDYDQLSVTSRRYSTKLSNRPFPQVVGLTVIIGGHIILIIYFRTKLFWSQKC